ncbi:hypothetical protein AXG93_1520s1420 [Marchantia polymorpha subsp. ruderalis]|uniref:Uncharacterized protein n=1 Tax=Marchantia polymorpha subsp. ruderalis TaxID=1480154 RepID=A0A176VG98_MARPO|nr:hypothetical protein AXG93_1520s1420 [Marchantia polymorpha subsp. ruderalis]
MLGLGGSGGAGLSWAGLGPWGLQDDGGWGLGRRMLVRVTGIHSCERKAGGTAAGEPNPEANRGSNEEQVVAVVVVLVVVVVAMRGSHQLHSRGSVPAVAIVGDRERAQ